jgi:hypothetical protein
MPLAVGVGLTLPQAPAPWLAQVTVQVTPALAESLLTVAVKGVVAPVTTLMVGGVTLTLIDPLAGVTVMVALAETVGSVTEVAVTVTVPPLGTAAGAVYVVAVPLAVWVGATLPQAPVVVQETLQVTPPFAESLPTEAVSVVVAFTATLAASGLTFTVTVGPPPLGTTVMTALAEILGSVTEAAVTVTVPPVGMFNGAMYVAVAPLAVCVGETVPQAPALAHETVQLTP